MDITKSENNHQRARESELQILHAIAQIGWLSATQIGAWVWGEVNKHSARVSADKCIKRLLEQKLIKTRTCSLRMQVFILTTKGACEANDYVRRALGLRGDITLFRNGYNLSQLDCGRQRYAVEYLTKQHRLGFTVFGAAGIRGAIQAELLSANFRNADGYVSEAITNDAYAVLVVRNTHPQLVEKAMRLQRQTGKIILLGSTALQNFFFKELKYETRYVNYLR